MTAHLAWEELVDYWADEYPDPDAIDEHTMACEECAQLSARVVAVTRALAQLLPPMLTTDALAKLRARGVRVGENALQPGERREIRFPAELDVLIHRLEGLPDDVVKLDFAMFAESTGAPIARLDDVPFAHGAALLCCQHHYATLPWDTVVELHATHPDGSRTQTQYTILHRFEQP